MTLSEHEEWLRDEEARRAAKDRARRPIPSLRKPKPDSGPTRGNGSGVNTTHRDLWEDQQDID